jgi:hypothetical protein
VLGNNALQRTDLLDLICERGLHVVQLGSEGTEGGGS